MCSVGNSLWQKDRSKVYSGEVEGMCRYCYVAEFGLLKNLSILQILVDAGLHIDTRTRAHTTSRRTALLRVNFKNSQYWFHNKVTL